jgi:hypothetical protein
MPSSTSRCERAECLQLLDHLRSFSPAAPTNRESLEGSAMVGALSALYATPLGRHLLANLEAAARSGVPRLLIFAPTPPTGLVRDWVSGPSAPKSRAATSALRSVLNLSFSDSATAEAPNPNETLSALVKAAGLRLEPVLLGCPRCGVRVVAESATECPTCQSTGFLLSEVPLEPEVGPALAAHFLLEIFVANACRRASLHLLDSARGVSCSLRFQISGEYPEADSVAITHRRGVLLFSATTRRLTVNKVGEELGKLSPLRDAIAESSPTACRVHIVLVTAGGLEGAVDPESYRASGLSIVDLSANADLVRWLDRLSTRV